MKKMINKIHTCCCCLRAGSKDNILANFLTGLRIKSAMTVLLGTCLLTFTACDNKEAKAPEGKPTIKIGANLPLSGDYAKIGQANKASMQLSLSDLQKNNLKYNYELMFEDDGGQARKSVMAANKLINMDKVNAITTLWGIVAPPVADMAQKAGVINMTCAGLSEVSKPYYVFNNYTQYHAIADTLIKKLKKEGVKSIVYAVDNNAVGDGQSAYISKELKKAGIKVLEVAKFNTGTTDYTLDIKKLEKLNPDYYVIFILMPGTKLFVEDFYQVTGKKNIAAIDVFHEMPQQYWPLVNGLWYTKSANGTPEFAKRFNKETGLNLESCVGNNFENINLLVWAYENTKPRQGELVPNNEDVVKTLQSVKNRDGVIGNYSIDENGIIQSKAALMMMQDGKEVALDD